MRNAKAIENLLQHGTNIKESGATSHIFPNPRSALTVALKWEHDAVTSVPLAWGADVNVNRVALTQAFWRPTLDITQRLIAVRATKDNIAPVLKEAASYSQPDRVSLLLASGADVNGDTKPGTPGMMSKGSVILKFVRARHQNRLLGGKEDSEDEEKCVSDRAAPVEATSAYEPVFSGFERGSDEIKCFTLLVNAEANLDYITPFIDSMDLIGQQTSPSVTRQESELDVRPILFPQPHTTYDLR